MLKLTRGGTPDELVEPCRPLLSIFGLVVPPRPLVCENGQKFKCQVSLESLFYQLPYVILCIIDRNWRLRHGRDEKKSAGYFT